MLILSSHYFVWFKICFSVLFQSDRPSRAESNILQQDTMVSLFIISTLCFQWTENSPQCHIPSVPLVPADLAIIFFLWQGFTVVTADHFALYQWALQSDHHRLPGRMWNKSFDSQSLMFSRVLGASASAGLELFCTSFSTAGPIKTSRGNFAVCSVKSISGLHQAKCLYEADTWELVIYSGYSGAGVPGSFKARTLCKRCCYFPRLASASFFFSSQSCTHTCQRSCLCSQLRGI